MGAGCAAAGARPCNGSPPTQLTKRACGPASTITRGHLNVPPKSALRFRRCQQQRWRALLRCRGQWRCFRYCCSPCKPCDTETHLQPQTHTQHGARWPKLPASARPASRRPLCMLRPLPARAPAAWRLHCNAQCMPGPPSCPVRTRTLLICRIRSASPCVFDSLPACMPGCCAAAGTLMRRAP